MLACARIGAVHSVVFGGFAAKELATRIDDAKPKLDPVGELRHRAGPRRPLQAAARRGDRARQRTSPTPASSCSGRRREAALDRRPRPRLGDAARRGDRAARKSVCDCVPVAATDPLYILYTSGTTGQPKGVVRDNGGHMVALKWSMQNLYGVEPGEVFWAASDVGWVVGHSYIVYAPLLHGCTTILYEGKPVGTPDAGAFWRVIAEHGVRRPVHRADRVPRDQEGGPAGQALRAIRPVEIPHAVPRRRARRSRHRELGGEPAEGAGDRSLVADRDRLGDRRQSGRARPAAGQARLADRGDAGLRRARRRRELPRSAAPTRWARSWSSCRCRRPACRRCGRRTSASRELPRRIPRLLQDRRRRLQGRGRLPLRHGPHRRHHQRRRPPALDRRHGGGARRATRTSPNAP